jgi:hypothetical protein
MPNSELGVRVIPSQTIRPGECRLTVMNPTKKGDERGNYTLHSLLHQDLHPAALEVVRGETVATARAKN